MEQEVELNIGERLRTLRNKHGLSQRALARKASVTNGIISLIEQNRTSPSVSTLKKILDAFPISLSDFFTFELAIQDKIVYSSRNWWRSAAADSPTNRWGDTWRRRPCRSCMKQSNRGLIPETICFATIPRKAAL